MAKADRTSLASDFDRRLPLKNYFNLLSDLRDHVGIDHHPAAGDVGDPNQHPLAAEDECRAVDDAAEPILPSLVGNSLFLAWDFDPDEAGFSARPAPAGFAVDRLRLSRLFSRQYSGADFVHLATSLKPDDYARGSLTELLI